MRGPFSIWYKAYAWLEDTDEEEAIFSDGGWLLIVLRNPQVKFKLVDGRESNS